MHEYEKKVMLTEKEYTALAEQSDAPAVIQTNYYFDSDGWEMNRRGVTCRIREKNGRFRAEIKRHCADRAECSTEVVLSEGTVFSPEAFSALGLYLFGELVTERRVLYRSADCEAVLDRNTYLGCTDYELEIEYTPRGAVHAGVILRETARAAGENGGFAHRVGSGGTKSARFFNEKRKREDDA